MDKRCKTLVRSRVPKPVFSKMEKWDWSEVTKNAMITASGSGSDWKVLTKFREFGQKMCRVRCRASAFSLQATIELEHQSEKDKPKVLFADAVAASRTSTANQYQLTAEMAGVIGNDYSGNILPITYIQGLESAQITDILIPGEDEETDDTFRQRLITALNEKPFGGNVAAYRKYIGGLDGPDSFGGGKRAGDGLRLGAEYRQSLFTSLKFIGYVPHFPLCSCFCFV